MSQANDDPERSARRATVEWVTLGISGAMLAAVVMMLGVLAFRSDEPARPTVSSERVVEQIGDRFLVSVEIVNRGDEAASAIEVAAEMVGTDGATSATQVIDFLGGGETQQLTFVMPDDPANAELVIEVRSFAKP